jgi:hypothetical protein
MMAAGLETVAELPRLTPVPAVETDDAGKPEVSPTVVGRALANGIEAPPGVRASFGRDAEAGPTSAHARRRAA